MLWAKLQALGDTFEEESVTDEERTTAWNLVAAADKMHKMQEEVVTPAF